MFVQSVKPSSDPPLDSLAGRLSTVDTLTKHAEELRTWLRIMDGTKYDVVLAQNVLDKALDDMHKAEARVRDLFNLIDTALVGP